MRDYIVKKYSLSIDFLDYSKNNQKVHIPFQESYLPFDMLNTNKDIVYSEKDTNTAFIEAQLLADGTVIDLSGYDKVAVGIKKNDGLRVHNDCNVLDASRGRIEIPFTSQSLASVGINYFDITLYKGKSELVSPRFSYRVMESMVDDSSLESSNEFGTLVLLIEKTDELLKRTNSTCDRVDVLEELVLKNESKRNENEELRKSNEISRNETEIERQTSESTRDSNEYQRVQSEIERVNFYNDASTKENQRIRNEETRVFEEDKRIQFENDRKSSEISRKNNEQDRVSSEIIRESHEDTRILSEITRVSNEEIRVEEFNGIKNEFNDLKNNTEVIQARTDEKNVTYENLKMRLDSMNNSNSSEPLLNENVTSFKVATGTVNGVNKDYTNEMEQSLVTLDNIEGKTVIKSNHLNEAIFTNRKLKCMYTLDELDNKNYFDDAVNLPVDGCSSSHTGNNIIVNTSSSEWMYTTYKVSNLEIGKVYCLNCDNVTILNGSSAIDIDIESRDYIISNRYLKHSGLPNHNANGLVFIANKSSIEFYFYCNMANDNIGNVIYNNVSLRVVKDYTQLDLDFRSVPDGTCDKLINSKHIQNINEIHITGNDNILEAGDSGEFKQFFVRIDDIKRGEVLADEFEFCSSIPLGWVKKSTSEGEHYQGQSIRVVDGNLYFKVSQTTLVDWKNWLNNIGGIKFIYKRNYPLVNYINPSILCVPGSTLYIDTPIHIDCTHKVQLNTKSQIEELQKSFESEKKSIWSKVKEIVSDISGFICEIGEDTQIGYIKLPKILGGFIIQWGQAGNQPNSPTARFNFPIALNYGYYTWYFSPQWSNSSDHYWVAGATDYKTFVSTHKCINTQVTDACRFLVIGR